MLISVLALTGFSAYFSQLSVYREQSEEKLQNTVVFLSELMKADGRDFIAYQQLSIALKDEINIPADFDGNYQEAKTAFYNAFDRKYLGKTPGEEVPFKAMPKSLQILYVTYRQEYWMHIFESTSKNLGVIYTYYLVPTGEEEHVYYIIDPVPGIKNVDGKDYIVLDDDIYEANERHKHLWLALKTGKFTPGYDVFDNEL